MIYGFSQPPQTNMLNQEGHILIRCVSHGESEEFNRVAESRFWLFEPDYALGRA